jgi:hypothetical protein
LAAVAVAAQATLQAVAVLVGFARMSSVPLRVAEHLPKEVYMSSQVSVSPTL